MLRTNRVPTGGAENLATDIGRKGSLVVTDGSVEPEFNPGVVKESVVDEEETKDKVGGLPSEDLAGHRQKTRALTLSMAEVKHIYVHEEHKVQEEEAESKNTTILGKILHVIQWPIATLAKFVIPNLEEEEIDKPLVPILPTTAVIACLILTKSRLASRRMGL